MKYSIKYKLASITLVILVPIVAYSGYHYFEMIGHEKEHIQNHNLEISANITRDLQEIIAHSFGILSSLSVHPAVMTRDSRACDRLFAKLLPSFPDHLNILAADMEGNNYGSGIMTSGVRLLNYRDKEWFIMARKGTPVVGDLHISKLFKAPAAMIAMPVVNDRGQQTGVIGLPLNLPRLGEKLFATWDLPEKSSITVIDSQGNILIDTHHEENVGANIRNNDIVQKAFSMPSGSEEHICPDGIRRLHSFSSVPGSGWKVIVGVPVKSAYSHAYAMGSHYLIMLLLVSLLALGLSALLSVRITRNLFALVAGLGEIERGNLSFTLKLSGHDELIEVAESFNRMAFKRKTADEKLRESEAFLFSVLEGIGEGVVVIDRNYKIISANKGYCSQVKMSCDDIIGKYCYEISHHINEPCHEKENGCECTVKRCFETGEPYRAIHTHYEKSGDVIYIETNAYPLRNASGAVSAAIETLMDVTGRVALEKQLEVAKEHYRKLYDNAPDMMHSVDLNGFITTSNMTETTALGYDPEELIGQPATKIIAPPAREAYLRRIESLEQKGIFEGELTYVTKKGAYLPVFVKEKALRDATGNIVMIDAVSRDIGEKKSLEAQLLQAQKMEAIGTLAGGVAHDFNNILTALIGYANLVQMKMEKDNASRPYVDQILASAERAAGLTQSLLAFSRKQAITLRPVSLNEVIRRVEKLLIRLIGEDIELKTVLSDTDTGIMADSGQIEQVLMNLATNARDAMPDGGRLTIKTECRELDQEFLNRHGYDKKGPSVIVSVTDTGMGMDETTRERIFDPFFTTKEAGKGTGLGLAIVYGIVKQHDGYIHCSSEPGRGTTFTIYLPAAVKEKSADARTGEAAQPSGGTETILLAEDDEDVRKLSRAVLEEFGYTVITASDGEEAVRKFREHGDRIQLLILDVVMPKRNGREVYDEIKKTRPDIKALFTSGYTAELIHKKGILDRDINFMSKPISPVELIRKVQDALHT